MKYLYKLLLVVVAATTATCERRSLDDGCPASGTLIPVRIDWRESGITPGSAADADYVHRVSLRFFPLDGSPAFDRYLEGNIFEGEIEVPVGSYSVVAYNEAIDDVYWEDNLYFSDVNDYNRFAANIVAQSPVPYDFYILHPGEQFVAEPLKLTSWKLDIFEVTPQMLSCTSCGADPNAMINALTKIVMQRLVTPVRVVIETTNLKSAMRMEAALEGMTSKVYMASGITHTQPTTHLFAFTAPVWKDASLTDGWVERRFLAFGRLPQTSQYALDLGVIFVTGERYYPDQPLHYDVTNQVANAPESAVEVRVQLTLPVVDGGIHIGDWDDDEIIIK